MSEMPKEIEMDAKHTVKGYLQVDQWSAKGGLRPAPINGNTRTKYIRADLTGLQCFYDYEGELPKKFIALYLDGSGCNMFYYSHDNQYGEKMYTSAADNDYIMGVDKAWFGCAGYLWFIALPDDFKVWGEGDDK